MSRYYFKVIEVDPEGKITYEYIGGFYQGVPQVRTFTLTNQHGITITRTRIYGSTKNELIEKLKIANLFTPATIFEDEIE